MMQFPKWKVILVLAVCAAGILFTVPNLLSRELADRLPSWLQPVSLGLDLQGGSHLLLEVDVAFVLKEQQASLVDAMRGALRNAKIRYTDLGAEAGAVRFRIPEASERENIRKLVRDTDPVVGVETGPDGLFILKYGEQAVRDRKMAAVAQSIEIVRRRIDELGTRESTIVAQGEERILVQLPGIDDPERIKRLLGKTAKMTFHLVDTNWRPGDPAPPGTKPLPSADEGRLGAEVAIRTRVELGGEMLTDSQATFQDGQPVVSFRLNAQGAKKFGQITQENVGKPFAIVLDGKVITSPVIREPILGGSGIISGNFTAQTAKDLAILLRAGALPAPLTILEERTVGPDLGADSIRAGKIATILGLIFVAVFMVVVYGFLGLIANVAMLLNLVLLLGALSALGATLTLPGIAGIVLTLGMAVDANVLIYERMREESKGGRTVFSACSAGFERAWSTIIDSNLTTLFAGILLFQFGTGPVKGFAVTLSLGILTTMFTAVMVTRLMIATWLRTRRPAALPLA